MAQQHTQCISYSWWKSSRASTEGCQTALGAMSEGKSLAKMILHESRLPHITGIYLTRFLYLPLTCHSYLMQVRPGKFNRLLHCSRLLQHFVCNAYVAVESNKLHWFKINQKTIRADTYQAVVNAQAAGATTGNEAGKQHIVLPSSFQGGPRFMKQLYQDTIALSTKFGPCQATGDVRHALTVRVSGQACATPPPPEQSGRP